MMQRYKDERLAKANLDEALDVGREYQRELCLRSGGDPTGIECTPLLNGGYRVRIAWTIAQPGGRRGRKRRQQQTADLIPPQAEELTK